MDDSIFLSVKKLLGIGDDNPDFDRDVLLYLNGVLSLLTQLGIGPSDGFSIEDDSSTWQEYLGNNHAYINMVKPYIAAKIRLMGFDTPVSSAVSSSLERICSEFEWRCNVAAENREYEEVNLA